MTTRSSGPCIPICTAAAVLLVVVGAAAIVRFIDNDDSRSEVDVGSELEGSAPSEPTPSTQVPTTTPRIPELTPEVAEWSVAPVTTGPGPAAPAERPDECIDLEATLDAGILRYVEELGSEDTGSSTPLAVRAFESDPQSLTSVRRLGEIGVLSTAMPVPTVDHLEGERIVADGPLEIWWREDLRFYCGHDGVVGTPLVSTPVVLSGDVTADAVLDRLFAGPLNGRALGHVSAIPLELWGADTSVEVVDGVARVEIDYDFENAPINNFSTSNMSQLYFDQLAMNLFQLPEIKAIDTTGLCCADGPGGVVTEEEWRASYEANLN